MRPAGVFRGFIGVVDTTTGKIFKGRLKIPKDCRYHRVELNWTGCQHSKNCACGIEILAAVEAFPAIGEEIHVMILQEGGTAEYTLLPWAGVNGIEEGFFPVNRPVNCFPPRQHLESIWEIEAHTGLLGRARVS